MLLVLASTIFLGSKSLPWGLVAIFYCLRLETSLSSPPTTRRVTVEVFDPASTWARLVSLLYNLGATTENTPSNNPIFVRGGCLTIDWILF
jgi:hypothetical protein